MNKAILILFVFLMSCASSNVQFVENIDQALDIIVPRYNDYISRDENFDANQIQAIIKSTKELQSMVKEELERVKK